MMWILLLLGTWLLIQLLNGPVKQKEVVGPCTIHKWEYENGRLRCRQCRRFPGEETD